MVEILDEEPRHFATLVDVVRDLGGDPTAQTLSTDAAAVVSMGVVRIVSSLRATLVQGLEAVRVPACASTR